MKHKSRYGRKKSKNIKKVKVGILSVAIVLIFIIGSGMIAKRIFNQLETVQATQDEKNTDTVGEKQVGKDASKVENSMYCDSPEFIEKYLNQQMRGEMPEGADGKKVVYLTFDDGPSETVTPQILDILKEKNVHATFFVLGKAVDSSDKNKELLKRAVEEGNAIGNHSYSHNYKYLYPNKLVNVDNFMEEIEKTNTSIKNVLGDDFNIKAVRFPGGHMTWKGSEPVDKIFEEKGYSYIDWNALSKDAEGPKKNAEQLKQETIKTAGSKEKVIILMHDTYGKEETAKALPDIIDYFKNQGYEFKSIQ